jgi:predicted RNase H-like nuclease (RuvC/YqgF family)
MTTKKSVTDDLRAQLVDIEGRQAELIAERDEHSFAAVVERQPAAIKKLEALNSELDNLKHKTASLQAALREATKREVAAAEAERAGKRRANAAAAAETLMRAENTAELLTKALADVRSHSLELQRQFAEIRGLIGVGATDQQLHVFLTRCVKTALMGTPAQIEHLAPNERTDVNAVVAPWAASIRNFINTAVGQKAKVA